MEICSPPGRKPVFLVDFRLLLYFIIYTFDLQFILNLLHKGLQSGVIKSIDLKARESRFEPLKLGQEA